jgi:peptidoglycan hydrolase CwlO-like protein
MNSENLKKAPIHEVNRKIDSLNKELNQIKQDITYIKNYITMKKKEHYEKILSEDQFKQQGWWFS